VSTVSRRRWTLRRIGVGLASACVAAAPSAETHEGGDRRDTLKIEVTGTNIPRTDGESMLPVQIITREEIQRSGLTTAAQVMAQVPANFGGFVDALSLGNGSQPGLASANLRGIGDGSTLVLLNGRRVANYAFNGATVDLNSIPLANIERIEILKDGASAIYGSDAIAGVVNFILRQDFTGVEITAYGAVPEHRGR
jgi:iron complex outermembrane receptor protein